MSFSRMCCGAKIRMGPRKGGDVREHRTWGIPSNRTRDPDPSIQTTTLNMNGLELQLEDTVRVKLKQEAAKGKLNDINRKRNDGE